MKILVLGVTVPGDHLALFDGVGCRGKPRGRI